MVLNIVTSQQYNMHKLKDEDKNRTIAFFN